MDPQIASMASRWKRLGGMLIDFVLTAPIMLFIMSVAGVVTSGEPMSLGQRAAFFVETWIVFLAINAYLLARKGQIIGKAAVGTRIVDESGDILDFSRLFGLRYLVPGVVYMIPFVGGLFSLVNTLFVFRKDRRCIHNHIAGTYVVDAQ